MDKNDEINKRLLSKRKYRKEYPKGGRPPKKTKYKRGLLTVRIPNPLIASIAKSQKYMRYDNKSHFIELMIHNALIDLETQEKVKFLPDDL